MNLSISRPASATESSTIKQNARLLLCLLYGVMAQTYVNLFYKVTVDVGPSRLVALANFTAFRPYQYRVLIPAIVHVLGRLTHADDYQKIALYQGIEWIVIFSAFWVFRAYLTSFIDSTSASILTLFLLPAMLFMHAVCAAGHYPYDTPQVVLFTLGLLALRKYNLTLFYCTLVLGTFNRESSVLLILAFALIMFDKMPQPKFALHLALQCALFAAIKLGIDHAFASNIGDFTEDHTKYNLLLAQKLIHLNPNVTATVLLIAGIAALYISGRQHIPDFARRLFWLFPIYVAAMWRVGVLDEIRAYNEMVPVLVAPLLLVFYGTLKANDAVTEIDSNSPPIELRNAA